MINVKMSSTTDFESDGYSYSQYLRQLTNNPFRTNNEIFNVVTQRILSNHKILRAGSVH